MRFSNLLFYIKIFIFNFPSLFLFLFSREDCYELISYPNVVLKLYSNSPTGPVYLYIKVRLEITNTYKYRHTILEKRYQFKKINLPCITTMKFTDQNQNLTQMRLSLNISLLDFSDPFIAIEYIFYPGFYPTLYLLIGKNTNFAIESLILHNKEEHLVNYITSLNNLRDYFNTISNIDDKLFIVSGNNKEIVIHSNYFKETPTGLITNIRVRYSPHLSYENYFEIHAFSCSAGKQSDFLIFIDEFFPNSLLYFSAIYWKVNTENIQKYESQFYLLNISRGNVHQLRNVPIYFKKLFLLKISKLYRLLANGSMQILYLSEDRTIYHSIEEKYDQISSNVVRKQIVHRP